MKFLAALGLAFTLVSAETLIIDAKHFEAFDDKGFSLFQGDVKLKKGKDKLNSDKLEVYLTKPTKQKKREPIKYIATGNVDFEVVSNGKHYEGKGDKVIYTPKDFKYTIIGNGYIKERVEDKTLFGNKIFINQQTGEARVHGTSNEPVRFILKLDDNKESKPKKNVAPVKPEVQTPVEPEVSKEVKTEVIIKKELTKEEEQMRQDAQESAKKMEALIEEKEKKKAQQQQKVITQ